MFGVLSCSTIKQNYDFGIAIQPINNLNYVKYPFINSILPTLIQGIGQVGISGEALKNQLQIPSFFLYGVNPVDPNIEEGGLLEIGFKQTWKFEMSELDIFSGILKIGSNGAFYSKYSGGGTKLLAFSLNGVQKWKGAKNYVHNRNIEAQDFIDFVKYVGDINVGSFRKIALKELKILGFEEFVLSQRNYLNTFGKSYKNPWGYNLKIRKESNYNTFRDNWESHWPQQNPGDKSLRESIKNAALKFLLEGMRLYPKGINKNVSDKDFSKTDFFIQFKKDQTQVPYVLFNTIMTEILPINKNFIDATGGIEEFGTTFDKWIYSSPFNISDIRLGQGGYIDLQKDDQWYTSSYTISRKIKIYFQENPNIMANMFEDRNIAAAKIPAIYVNKFWNIPEKQQFMGKSPGVGTLALQLNIDKETNGDSPLQNINFRKAIAHAINRGRLSKLLNWEFSFPITTWTIAGTIYSSNAEYLDNFLASEYFYGPFNSKRVRLSSFKSLEHESRNYKFESSDKIDNRFNPDEAWKYYEQYVKETGDTKVQTLTFLAESPQNSNAAYGIQTMLKSSLRNKVKINLKTVPPNAYETMRQEGQFDLTTYNFDNYGSNIDSYVKRLFWSDGISKKINKNKGFIENPTGSWTFYEWYLKSKNNLDAYERYFEIPQKHGSWKNKVWKKLLDVIKIEPQKINDKNLIVLNKKLSDTLESIWSLSDDLINTPIRQFYFLVILEKIIALSAPVIPLTDVDNTWHVSRLYGLFNLYTFPLQFTYDVLKKPSPSLPGREAWINEKG